MIKIDKRAASALVWLLLLTMPYWLVWVRGYTALGTRVMVLSLAAGRLEDAGRVEDALPLLLRAKKLAPAAPGILNALGLCLQRLGRFEESPWSCGESVAEKRSTGSKRERLFSVLVLTRPNMSQS